MQTYPLQTLDTIPLLLREIPKPPEQLYLRGEPLPDIPLLAVVGSRKYTSYGKAVVDHIIAGLADYEVGIVSGLAIGMDGLAHEAALRHNLYTLAVPGGGLDDSVLYPVRHKRLAYSILEAGGSLLSEFEPTQHVARWTFPQRNRIVCGMCQATVIIEANEKSGSLITARLATDFNRELFVVPGDIFSDTSRGTHQFLKLGAHPLTTAEDIISTLGLKPAAPVALAATPGTDGLAPQAQAILNFLTEPRPRDEIIRELALPTTEANSLLMQLELTGHIIESDGVYRRK
jgi:DNA processing protein